MEILTRYKLKTAKELEELIRKGKIEEHPSWEDLITLENLDAEVKIIENDIRKIRKYL